MAELHDVKAERQSDRYWRELALPTDRHRMALDPGAVSVSQYNRLRACVEDCKAELINACNPQELLPPFGDLAAILKQSPRYALTDIYHLKDWELLRRANDTYGLLVFVFAYVASVPKQDSDFIDSFIIEDKLACRVVIWYYPLNKL